MIETACACGAIRLTLAGEPHFQVYCHCSECQAAHGAAYRLSAVYPKDAVSIDAGEPAAMTVRSTPRMICGGCGTHLFIDTANGMFRSVNAYLLPNGRFAPQFHIHCEDAVLPVADGLPHYRRVPAKWGGSDAVMEW